MLLQDDSDTPRASIPFPQSAREHSAQDSSPADLVISIHGTYAARESDEGDSWWQTGSDTWHAFRDRLPSNVRLADKGEVFHWSGENSERARLLAAHKLLNRLKQLENQGQAYHLIGHSHGGSLLWHCLRLAQMQQLELLHLRSWTTVGTPFLQLKTRGAWNVVNLINLILAVVLFKPGISVIIGLATVIVGPFFGMDDVLHIPAAEVPARASFLDSPVLRTVEILGMYETLPDGSIRIGHYHPEEQSIYSYLFLSREGLTLLGIAGVIVFVYLNLAGFFLTSFLESMRIRTEEALDRVVREKYEGRWLGIWSPDDEAINGLRATLSLSMSFVSKMAPKQRVLFSDHLSLLSRPYYWLFAPIYNRFARPAMDSAVRSFVIKAAQGNNRPSAEVVSVSPVPWRGAQSEAWPALPDSVNQRIVAKADEHARDIAPKLRQMIAQPALGTSPDAFANYLSGQEMVHTSYFDHAEIMDLLAMHIALFSPSSDARLHTEESKEHLEWFQQFKQKAGVVVSISPTEDRKQLPLPPRRRGRLADAA